MFPDDAIILTPFRDSHLTQQQGILEESLKNTKIKKGSCRGALTFTKPKTCLVSGIGNYPFAVMKDL
jgi:hypothetical protein